jgi:nicotinamidase-related amidase
MDVQTAIVKQLERPEPLLTSLRSAINTAHARHIPVIYAVVGFRTGFPEVSPSNRSFSILKANPVYALDQEANYQVHEALRPGPDDLVVLKKRVSAFSGSDLEIVLRSLRAEHLVLCGISSSGVVLSTLREAADKDYRITILEDCCADRDEEVQQVLMRKIFPRQAIVTTAAEWIEESQN